MRKIVVGITGASGIQLAMMFLTMLRSQPEIETGCILSEAAAEVAHQETELAPAQINALAARFWAHSDLGAGPASGSWWKKGDAMVVIPCSMSTLGAVASGHGSSLVHRCCDVALKERRSLILVTRESPLSLIHLRNMEAVTSAGAIVMPFSPTFYLRPAGIAQMLQNFCRRIFDLLDIAHSGPVWGDQER